MRIGRSRSDAYRRMRLGDAQDGQIGGQIGTLVSSISGVPGIGQIASLIGGLFGPSAHYTPSGMLFDTAANLLKTQAVTLANLQNELWTQWHVGASMPVPAWSMTSADDPKTGPYIANILNNPSYASATSPDPLIALQKSGVYDAVIAVQKQLISSVGQVLDGLENGTLHAVNGRAVPVAVPALANSYNDVVNGQNFEQIPTPAGYPAPPSGLVYVQNSATGQVYQSDQQTNTLYDPQTGQPVNPAAAVSAGSVGMGAGLSSYAPYLLGGGALLLLLFLLKKRGGGNVIVAR